MSKPGTTRVGSLPRPADVVAAMTESEAGPRGRVIGEAVRATVRKQVEVALHPSIGAALAWQPEAGT